ncbi:MAG: apolipoprotein N-acyltransferase [Alphaproteobacteria bacterium]|nr:apolipoprotein N-acyltransferase [Alphaproteobacteria bacterium]
MADTRAPALRRGAAAAGTLQRWSLRVVALSGWRRYGLAALLGALAAAALPPVDLTPVLLVSFGGLVWLADGNRDGRQAFALGWSFGFGFFAAGLYWIGVALTVDWAQFWWLFPIAELAIPAGLAVFTGLALFFSDATSRVFRLSGSGRVCALAVSWAVFEYLRGHVLTGFPWNLVGYAWSGGFPGSIAMLQIASITGIYGLSFITVLAAALPARLAAPAGARVAAVAVAAALIAGMAAFGAGRLAANPRDDLPGVTLRLVQPSIPQTLFNDPNTLVADFHRLLGLTLAPGFDKVSAVIWAESMGPPFLHRDAGARAALAQAAPPGGIVISGTLRSDPPPARIEHYWNSLAVVDHAAQIVATYDKHHLVPFGEYVPFRGILPMNKITPGTVDFSAGPGPRTIDLPRLPPVSPLICYEAIFPEEVVEPGTRPQWLLNITNDAWYGFTSGPFQHFAIARVRTVEQGLPLVRDGNNGISAVIDPLGRIVARLGLDDVGVLDAPLPRALTPTLYARFGDAGFFLLLLIGVAAAAGATGLERRRPPRPRRSH